MFMKSDSLKINRSLPREAFGGHRLLFEFLFDFEEFFLVKLSPGLDRDSEIFYESYEFLFFIFYKDVYKRNKIKRPLKEKSIFPLFL